jgi:predicted nucleic acid-binding protein
VKYLIDSGPLGILANPRWLARRDLQTWIHSEVRQGHQFVSSEVVIYEVRRELCRLVFSDVIPKSRLDRLDYVCQAYSILSMTSKDWNLAADFWAEARAKGYPTSHPEALDADVLIAAQATNEDLVVLTMNSRHMNQFAPVREWII